MTPAGPERDREIAIYKERAGTPQYCMYRSGVPIEFKGDAPACIKSSIAWPECGHCRIHTFKPYSTDIPSAIELWNEMVKAKLMPTLKTIWIEEGKLGYRVSCEGGHFMHETWDIPDAISGAWQIWKESK